MGTIDSKVAGGSVGVALAGVVWTLLAAFVDRIGALEPEVLAGLVGSTGLVLQFVIGYLLPNAASPVPGDGVMPASLERDVAP